MHAPRILAAALALAAAGCAKTLPTQSPIAVSPLTLSASEWRVADQVFVITDGSGTMYVNETFPEAKALTQSFVAAMPEANAPAERPGGYAAGSIGFGGDDRITSPLAPFDRAALARNAQKLHVMGSIDGMGGPTPLHAVLGEVQAMLEDQRGQAALVIFSDGLPDAEEETLAAAGGLIAGYRDGVCVHAVQIGRDAAGREFLTRLAGLTPCGSVRNSQSLRSASDVTRLARTVFAGPARQLPPVGAGPCEEAIRLRGIEFSFDEAEIAADGRAVLDVAVETLKRCEDVRLSVEGHTDSMGPEDYNQWLSQRRAQATRRYLVGAGIGEDRLTSRGLGESAPLDSNETREGRARNRRVELKPLP